MRTQAVALDWASKNFTAEQWRELFVRSKRWPRNKWGLLYPAYLRSRAWNAKRMARHEIDGFRCMECGRGHKQGAALQCHHLTYDCIGNEDVNEDLITLCTMCHKVEHYDGAKPLRYHLALVIEEIVQTMLSRSLPDAA